jgi:hypothetical protein
MAESGDASRRGRRRRRGNEEGRELKAEGRKTEKGEYETRRVKIIEK